MLIKTKSLVVAIASSAVITLVLILTLISYVFYVEFKARASEASYRKSLSRLLLMAPNPEIRNQAD